MLQDTHVLQDIHVELHEKKGLNGNLVSRRVSLAGYQVGAIAKQQNLPEGTWGRRFNRNI